MVKKRKSNKYWKWQGVRPVSGKVPKYLKGAMNKYRWCDTYFEAGNPSRTLRNVKYVKKVRRMRKISRKAFRRRQRRRGTYKTREVGVGRRKKTVLYRPKIKRIPYVRKTGQELADHLASIGAPEPRKIKIKLGSKRNKFKRLRKGGG